MLAAPAWAGVAAPDFAETDVVSGLVQPTAMAFLPDGRMLVTQLGGEVLVVSGGSAKLAGTIPVCSVPGADFEMGLLGVAVGSTFQTEHAVYFYRTLAGTSPCDVPAPDRYNQVICVRLGADDTIDVSSTLVFLSGIRTDTGYHNGGGLRVGPDELLYIGVGDTGLGDDAPPGSSTNPYAQDLGALEGKILRLDLTGRVPANNPFVGQPGKRPEIFAFGFRNPFRGGFDPATGKFWVGDVGEDTLEEIDVVSAGASYGWPHCEGTLPDGCARPGDVPPVFTYPHDGAGSLGTAVIGGAFAGGGAFAALAGRYFFGDYGDSPKPPTGAIWYVTPNAARDGVTGPATPVITDAGGPVDLTFGPDGALYYVSILAGAVRRVTTTLVPGPGTCTTPVDCAAVLRSVLPSVADVTGKSRKVARKLGRLAGKADGKAHAAGGASGKKQAKLYGAARKLVTRLLSAARLADGKHTLGVALGPIEGAASAFLATLPHG